MDQVSQSVMEIKLGSLNIAKKNPAYIM